MSGAASGRRARPRAALGTVIVAAWLAGCAPAADSPSLAMSSSRARSFWDAPFPALDLIRDGKVDVGGFPNPARIALVERGKALIGRDARGFGLASGVFFRASQPLDLTSWPAPDRRIRLIEAASGNDHPIDVHFREEGGAFGAPNMLVLLPANGRPLAPATRYVAVVTTGVRAADGDALAPAGDEATQPHADLLDRLGIDRDAVAGLTVFDTDDPLAAFDATLARGRTALDPAAPALRMVEVHQELCVFEGELVLPEFQSGEPPYAEEGGAWIDTARPVRSRLVVTIPRGDTARSIHPLAVFVRTGGGGDRPLVDRGVRGRPGGPALAPATGPALELARAGYAGLSIDGPHGGPRNTTRTDEQFAMFNFQNPVALRDNVRQSALELALLPSIIERLDLDTSRCPGAAPRARFDARRLALMGHSMGATIAPLAAYGAPEYRAVILSGAGASWIENLLHKQKPLDVRVLAEAMLGYTDRGMHLTGDDPVLSIVQWAIEPADPLVFAPALARRPDLHVLMFQGIVDHYIMPPIAHALSVSLELDHAGETIDREAAALEGYASLAERQAAAGLGVLPLPLRGNRDGRTRAVVQHREDGIEDGHEVMFQLEIPKHQYRCFLETLSPETSGPAPAVVAGGAPCPR